MEIILNEMDGMSVGLRKSRQKGFLILTVYEEGTVDGVSSRQEVDIESLATAVAFCRESNERREK